MRECYGVVSFFILKVPFPPDPSLPKAIRWQHQGAGERRPPVLAPDIWMADTREVPANALWEKRWGPVSKQLPEQVLRTRICSRRLLESVLAVYHPGATLLPIARDALGRPRLVDGSLDFNLSHSGDRVVVAITAGDRVGVDVEQIKHSRDWLALAERFFSRQEAAHLAACGESTDLLASKFHILWTAKEAALKARGCGISAGLAQTSICRAPDGRLQVLTPGTAALRLFVFWVAAGYPAAVAWTGTRGASPAFFHWNPAAPRVPCAIN